MGNEGNTMLKFVKCINCGKTTPKHETGNGLLDSMEPAQVWCSQAYYDEWFQQCLLAKFKREQCAKRGTH